MRTMPNKSGIARKGSDKDGRGNAVIPVRLKRSTYGALVGIKGLLIVQKGRNVSLSESVDELVRVFYEKSRTSNMRTND